VSKGRSNAPSQSDGENVVASPKGTARPPLLKSAARTRASGTAVSRRVAAKLVKVAKAFGIERYDIIFEASGQFRLSVGSEHIVGSSGAEQNDFDREFG
jgi:hypothetical protein